MVDSRSSSTPVDAAPRVEKTRRRGVAVGAVGAVVLGVAAASVFLLPRMKDDSADAPTPLEQLEAARQAEQAADEALEATSSSLFVDINTECAEDAVEGYRADHPLPDADPETKADEVYDATFGREDQILRAIRESIDGCIAKAGVAEAGETQYPLGVESVYPDVTAPVTTAP